MAEEKENQPRESLSGTQRTYGTALSQTAHDYGEKISQASSYGKDYVSEKMAIREIGNEEELEALISECLAEVERTREKMSRDQPEIDRLKSETRMMISRLLAA